MAEKPTAPKAADSPQPVAAPPSTPPPPPSPPPVAAERHLRLAEHASNRHRLEVPTGVSVKQALAPIYLWPHHARLRRGDIIDIVGELVDWYAKAIVRHIDSETRTVHVTLLADPVVFAKGGRVALDFSAVRIENKGAAGKWTVQAGTEVWKDGFETVEEAESWLARKRNEVVA